MRTILLLLCIAMVCGCVSSDPVSKRRYGQQHVCHDDRTLAVSTADMFVHQDHGDTLGPCPDNQ